WRGPNQDGISQETGLADAWPQEGPKVLWRLPLAGGFSSVSAAGGIACTMIGNQDGEFVVAVDPEKGSLLWKTRVGDLFVDEEYGSGPRATPTIDQGRVFALGGTGALACLDAKTGASQWGFSVVEKFAAENAEFGASASPLVVGDKLIVVAGKSQGKSLVCLNKETGDTIWTALDDKAGYATPVLCDLGGTPVLAVFTAKALVAVGLDDGRELWRSPWETTMDQNVATPVCHDGKVFISSRNTTGSTLFQFSLEGGKFQAEPVWESRDMKNYLSTCLLVDGHLYGFNATRLTCLNFESGEASWRESGFNKGSLIAAGKRLIILGERGELALAEAATDQYREISKFQLFDSLTWVVPTLADGRLYVRSDTELVCLDLRK
ncbi:MAG: PQQ-binding-like beta-propeller repeat protein, partial [Thermoguttaceae bacterium]